jgi:hypothetical protein
MADDDVFKNGIWMSRRCAESIDREEAIEENYQREIREEEDYQDNCRKHGWMPHKFDPPQYD